MGRTPKPYVKPVYVKKLPETGCGQKQLLIEIINNHGRTAAVCELVGMSYPLLSYWRNFGRVPLGRVGEISRALDEDIYAFNYEEVAKLLGSAPKWEQVVKSCGLSAERAKVVLSKTPPKTVRELV